MQPQYLSIARKYVGLKETSGPATSPTISRWLKALETPWTDDETPWCGTFVAAIMQEAAMPYPKLYFRAKEWATYGEAANIETGAIAVLERVGGGHVGFVTGQSKDGLKVRLLGGNQGNMVSEAWFDVSRVVAWRKPKGVVLYSAEVAAVGTMSKSEA